MFNLKQEFSGKPEWSTLTLILLYQQKTSTKYFDAFILTVIILKLLISFFIIFQSLVAIGGLFGGLLGGYLIDKIGRKHTIMSTSLFYTSGWLLIGLSFCYYPKGTKGTPHFPKHYTGLV